MEGWQVHSIREATALGDTVVLLIPDEVRAEVYERDMRDNLGIGALLAFAHRYNILYANYSRIMYEQICCFLRGEPMEYLRNPALFATGLGNGDARGMR